MSPDRFEPGVRSRIMRAIKRRDTKPERIVRSYLHRTGLRFRLNRGDLPGTPDIVLPRFRAVIFVHGCFWHQHGCKLTKMPKSNKKYWLPKLSRNVQRDREARRDLKRLGWRVFVVWECQLSEAGLRRLVRFIRGGKGNTSVTEKQFKKMMRIQP